MNKKFLPLLALASVGIVLTGCGPTTTPGQDRTFNYSPSDVMVNYSSVAIYAGSSVELNVRILPINAYNAKLLYVSENENVATVNEKGLITGVANGSTTVKIVYTNDLIEYTLKEIPVFVSTKVAIGDELGNAVTSMLNLQKSKYKKGVDSIDKVHCKENRETYLYKNGVLQTTEVEECEMIGSKSDAYFYIRDRYTETRCSDGAISIDDFNWYIFADEDYNAALYYQSEAGRKRLIAPGQSYLGRERVEVTYHLLDTIFSSGKGIMTNLYNNALSTSELTSYTQYKTLEKCGGIATNTVSYELEQNNYSYTSDYDDERYSDIPFGVTVSQDYWQNITWINGIAKNIDLKMVYKYKFKGDDYRRQLVVRYSIDASDDITVSYPDDTIYQEVYNLFDLF